MSDASASSATQDEPESAMAIALATGDTHYIVLPGWLVNHSAMLSDWVENTASKDDREAEIVYIAAGMLPGLTAKTATAMQRFYAAYDSVEADMAEVAASTSKHIVEPRLAATTAAVHGGASRTRLPLWITLQLRGHSVPFLINLLNTANTLELGELLDATTRFIAARLCEALGNGSNDVLAATRTRFGIGDEMCAESTQKHEEACTHRA